MSVLIVILVRLLQILLVLLLLNLLSGGYVLDFSNARFSDFIKTAVGFDPYEKYPPASKAVLLRTLWHEEPMPVVAKVVLELLEHWRVGKLVRTRS